LESHPIINFLLNKLSFVFLAVDPQGITLLILLLVVLLMLVFTISGAEVAIFSLNEKDINVLKTKQHPAAKRIINFLDEPKEVFASLLIASTFLNICLIVLMGFLINQYLPYGTMQLFGEGFGSYIFELLLRVIIIGLILIFLGQILPRVWATQNNLRFAYGSAVVVEGVHLVLRRISKWVVSLADSIGRGMGANKSEALSIQELDEAIDIKTEEEASIEEELHALNEALGNAIGQQRRRLRGVECGFDLVDELVCAGTSKKHHEARIRAELSATHQTARREVCCHLAAALGQRTGENHHGIDARHLEVDGLPCRIGGALQRHAGSAASGECARAHTRV
jgi:uncharacterized membrane protein